MPSCAGAGSACRVNGCGCGCGGLRWPREALELLAQAVTQAFAQALVQLLTQAFPQRAGGGGRLATLHVERQPLAVAPQLQLVRVAGLDGGEGVTQLLEGADAVAGHAQDLVALTQAGRGGGGAGEHLAHDDRVLALLHAHAEQGPVGGSEQREAITERTLQPLAKRPQAVEVLEVQVSEVEAFEVQPFEIQGAQQCAEVEVAEVQAFEIQRLERLVEPVQLQPERAGARHDARVVAIVPQAVDDHHHRGDRHQHGGEAHQDGQEVTSQIAHRSLHLASSRPQCRAWDRRAEAVR